MKIAHFAPFAPYEAGIYEAARDMMRADIYRGHIIGFVDAGKCYNEIRQPRQVGTFDIRGKFKIETTDLNAIKDYDLFVVHDGSQAFDKFFAETKTPIVKPIHIRPAMCFKTSMPLYKFYYSESRKHQVRALFTMWKEHMPYWLSVIPKDKLFCTDDPPIDHNRFNTTELPYEFQNNTKDAINILIADSWREDVDIFHILHGVLLASNVISNIKVHICSVQKNSAADLLFDEMKHKKILGEVQSRVKNIASLYRACDLLISPHRIATRVMGEAICCGLPVLAATGCRYTPHTCQMDDAVNIAENLISILRKLPAEKSDPAPFALERYSEKINGIYNFALEGKNG